MLNGTSIPTHEIEEILRKLKQTETPITEKRPSLFNEIRNLEQRQKELRLFHLAKELYIGPLENYLTVLTHGEGSYNKPFEETDDLSIVERAVRMRNTILKHGGTLENILNLVPKTEEEQDILMCAKNNGFPLNHTLSNNEKVAAAQQYLNTIGISPTNDNLEPRTR